MAHTEPFCHTSAGYPVFTRSTAAGPSGFEAHDLAFRVWPQLSFDAQVEGFQIFLYSRSNQKPLWLDIATYQACLPAAATDPERRLFACQIEILLAIHRHRCRIQDAGYERVERMLNLANSENGRIQVALKLMTGCLQTSSNYLGAQFLHRTQLSFRQYLRLVRTRRAVELLRSRDLSIHRVAAALGHADAAHFTREIRAELGVPPRVLRQVFGHRNSHPSAGGG